MFTVYSTDGVTKFNHGDCKRYIQAASLARIVRRTFPNRIVLVDIPANYRPAQPKTINNDPPSAGFLLPAIFSQGEQSNSRKALFPRIPQHQAINPNSKAAARQQQGSRMPEKSQLIAVNRTYCHNSGFASPWWPLLLIVQSSLIAYIFISLLSHQLAYTPI